MLPLGLRQTLQGIRTGDQTRATIGGLMLLWVAYRSFRRRTALIARYEIREGDELKVRLPKERDLDGKAIEAAILAAMAEADVAPPTIDDEPELAAADLYDDLLAAATAEDEGEHAE